MDAKQEGKTPPVATFRIGNVKAAVWKNEKGFYGVTFARAYKDAEGNWKDGASFNHADLPVVARVAERAETFIAQQGAEGE